MITLEGFVNAMNEVLCSRWIWKFLRRCELFFVVTNFFCTPLSIDKTFNVLEMITRSTKLKYFLKIPEKNFSKVLKVPNLTQNSDRSSVQPQKYLETRATFQNPIKQGQIRKKFRNHQSKSCQTPRTGPTMLIFLKSQARFLNFSSFCVSFYLTPSINFSNKTEILARLICLMLE